MIKKTWHLKKSCIRGEILLFQNTSTFAFFLKPRVWIEIHLLLSPSVMGKVLLKRKRTLKKSYETCMTEIRIIFTFNNSVVKSELFELVCIKMNEFIVELLSSGTKTNLFP